jgi:ribosome-binding protein aMBF1 (putative translation factor)
MISKKGNVQIHSFSPVLSEAIKQCRIAQNMSPQQLAARIRKSTEFVHDLENAMVAIDSPTLEDCAAAFGLSAGELVEIALRPGRKASPLKVDSTSQLDRVQVGI